MRKLVALVLVLCFAFSTACAMAEDKQELKVGSMIFQLPADAVSAGPVMAGAGYEAQIFMNEKFVIVLATLDLDTIEANVVPADGQHFLRRLIKDDNGQTLADESVTYTTMDWALQLLVGADAATALATTDTATAHHPFGADGLDQPNGQTQLHVYNQIMGYISTCRNGTGVFISTMLNQGVTDADPYPLGVEIAGCVAPADAQE